MKRTDFSVTIASDLDYDKLVAEIYIADKFVALLNQDDGPEFLKIDFSRTSAMSDTPLSVDFNVFVAALAEAKRQLLG